MYKVYVQYKPRLRTKEELESPYNKFLQAIGVQESLPISTGGEYNVYDDSGMRNFYLVEDDKCVLYIPCGIVTEVKFDKNKVHSNLILLEDLITKENYYGNKVSYVSDENTHESINLLYKKEEFILYEYEGVLVPEHLDTLITREDSLDPKYSDYDYILDKLQNQITDQGLPYKLEK